MEIEDIMFQQLFSGRLTPRFDACTTVIQVICGLRVIPIDLRSADSRPMAKQWSGVAPNRLSRAFFELGWSIPTQ